MRYIHRFYTQCKFMHKFISRDWLALKAAFTVAMQIGTKQTHNQEAK